MGHHEGSYLIDGDIAKLLDNTTGYWTFLPLQNVLPASIMVAGTYNGISFYDYKNNSFVQRPAKAAFESARFVTIDNDNIWVSHPYKGVYRVQLNDGSNPTVALYADQKWLSTNGNYIFKIKNRIVAATEKGIYEYNAQKDNFEPSAYFRDIFGNMILRYMKEDAAGNIWFVFDKNLGVVDFSGDRPASSISRN